MLEIIILIVVVGIVWFMLGEGLNFVGAARETAKVGAKVVAEVPNAAKWTRNELKNQNLEYKVQVEEMGGEYKKSFKETYKEQRVDSNKRYAPVFKEQEARYNELAKRAANFK